MRAVDEAREGRRLAEAARRREQPDRLVAPGLVERVLVDRHQLEMGEAHVDGVGDEALRELVVGEPAVAVAALPRAQVDLVDRHRPAARVALRALGHPRGVVPLEAAGVADDRRGRRPELGGKADRVGLERQQLALRAQHLVLVDRPFADAGNEDLPDAGVDAAAHRVHPAVPGVEVADDRHAGRVRRPDGEVDARRALVDDRVRAQPVVQPHVRAFAEQPVVHRAQHRRVRVWVVDRPAAAVVARAQQVARALRQDAFEEAPVVPARERASAVRRRG